MIMCHFFVSVYNIRAEVLQPESLEFCEVGLNLVGCIVSNSGQADYVADRLAVILVATTSRKQ